LRSRYSLPGRIVRGHPVLIASVLAGALVAIFLPASFRPSTRMLVSWDAGVALYLALIAVVISRGVPDSIKKRAVLVDEGKLAILLVVVFGAAASLAAIVVELASHTGAPRVTGANVALALGTVALSWTFTNVVFAMHYAHEYYGPDTQTEEPGDIREGLDIPGDEKPGYGDFLYFSFVIGCACATADINIRSRSMRKVAMIHGIVAFAFNTAILAFSINIAAGLLQSGS
jgi:uncharacterized membrane protein